MPSLPSFGSLGAVGAGLGAILVLLFIGFLFWQQGMRRDALKMRVEQEVTDSTRYATTIALINSLQQRQDTIVQKINVIRNVDQRRFVWPHLMDEISRSVPQYTWLTQITSTERGAVPAAEGAAPTPLGPALTIQGNAGSTQALTRLMKNLEASPFIRGVTLVTSEQEDVQGRMIHKFTIEASYETPDSTLIETVPVIVVN
jgi:Tfp pilus assembly protein PilN